MGGLILTVVELAKTIAEMGNSVETRVAHDIHYSPTVTVTKSMTYIFRFIFHCVQFTFLFRYGNVSFF
jgi:hypothetical protein